MTNSNLDSTASNRPSAEIPEPDFLTQHWSALMTLFGFEEHKGTLDRLLRAWGEKHRHYHTTAHLVHCLKTFDSVRSLAENAEEIELALWFHDAIYKPFASDNERQSTDWALNFLGANAAASDAIARVEALIMVTCHDAIPDTMDEALMIDVDLSILGASPERFQAYEKNVRREYRWVPWAMYRRRRGKILNQFMERDRLFYTDHFHQNLDNQARANLVEAISELD